MAQTQCFAIYRNNVIVMATWKEATLIEYVDQLPGNRRSGLTGRQKLSLIQQPCLLPGFNAPSLPHVTGSSGGSLSLACLRRADLHSLILPLLDNHAQSLRNLAGQDSTLPPSMQRAWSALSNHKVHDDLDSGEDGCGPPPT